MNKEKREKKREARESKLKAFRLDDHGLDKGSERRRFGSMANRMPAS
jgi:hypothetical protein